MAEHLPAADLVQAHKLTGGVSADVYRLDILVKSGTQRRIVLRVHGNNHNGHAAAVEFDILRALMKLGICVPRVLALDESRRHIPHPYLLLDHIEGDTVVPTNPQDDRIAEMAEMLARIHALPLAGLPGLPARIDPLPELFDYLPDSAEFHQLRRSLSKLSKTRYVGPSVLLHGDFWPGNLLWNDQTLVGILDWEDAACGDPLSDVACAALELTYCAGREGADHFLRAYDRRRPIDTRRLALWQIFVAAAGHHSMGAWGLEAGRESRMRATALAVIREAAALVI